MNQHRPLNRWQFRNQHYIIQNIVSRLYFGDVDGRKAYTGATEVTEPAAVDSVGKGVSAHDASMSSIVKPAGITATLEVAEDGVGMTSEQSTRVLGSKPRTAIFAIAAVNFCTIRDWSATINGLVSSIVRRRRESSAY